ncbi:MAG: sialidase family protein [Bacillota bacterium]|nr:sialidase family protein [Bacillota bacterium]
MKHVIVCYSKEKWCAVPANNGGCHPTWQWGDELLAGFTQGDADFSSSGHQVNNNKPFVSCLARSLDGGETWTSWQPEHYQSEQCDHNLPAAPPQTLTAAIDFTHPNLVIRVEGNGYHGNSGCQWFYSLDRGATWAGAFDFGHLMQHPELKDSQFTARTAYLVESAHECLFFLSVRAIDIGKHAISQAEKAFLARTRDGGRSFQFVSWIVPPADPFRAVMPSPVRLTAGNMVTAVRRRDGDRCWIDAYATVDHGIHWAFHAKIGETGAHNGNPPALIQLRDKRLCCVFGNRDHGLILAKYSSDKGRSWLRTQMVRDDMLSINGYPDIGYPRLFQRTDNRLVAVYFWCSPEKPQTHIAATIFDPPASI